MDQETGPTPPSADTLPAGMGLTLAELSRRWRIGGDKLRRFLKQGQLIGFNVAGSLSGKPQWRVSPEEVARFENRRSSVPPKPTARRRKAMAVDFFPD
jgi:hypothetical protein